MNLKQPTDATQEVLYYLLTRDYVTYKVLSMRCEIQRPDYHLGKLKKLIKLDEKEAIHENEFGRKVEIILWSAECKEETKDYYYGLIEKETKVYKYYLNHEDNRIPTIMRKFKLTKPMANKIINKGLDGKINIEI